MLLVLLLAAGCTCISSLASYSLMNSIKSGDHQLLTSTFLGPTSRSYVQPFFISFARTPAVIISIRDMKVSSSGAVNYQVAISLVNATNFTSTVTISDSNTYNLLYYMYMGIDTVLVSYTYVARYSLNTNNMFPDTNTTVTFPQALGNTITSFSNAVVTPFVVSFALTTTH